MTNESNTRYKLREADFFLDKLEPHRPYFDFYLSAYLNASRSVTWIMRNEYQNIPKWEDWYKNSALAEDEKALLKQINELRIQSTKQNGVQTEFFFLEHLIPDTDSYSEIERMQSEFNDCEVKLTISESTSEKNQKREGEYVISGRVKMERDQSLRSREELYDLCKKYYEFLRIKVEECTDKFGTKE